MITEKQEEQASFAVQLTDLINRNSLENGSDTPDFILAEFLSAVLIAWNEATKRRDAWYEGNEEP